VTSVRRVSDLGQEEFARRISRGEIALRFGPFNAHITAAISSLHDTLYRLYFDHGLVDDDDVYSFRAELRPRRNFPRWHRRSVRFLVDGVVPHEDLPIAQALPVLEWGMNLVIAMRSHCYLMLHSAVLERDGRAILLPAAPGFGKSTLCAALAHSGWRLLSDEFGLIRPGTSRFVPVPRPIALKEESIDVVRRFAPEATIGPTTPGTRKGTVAHVKPPTDSVLRQDETAQAKWVVFPRWQADIPLKLEPIEKSHGFMMLATNAFNYDLLGEPAFDSVSGIIDDCQCFRLEYSDLHQAIKSLDQLVENHE
jgi:HprK-related kinase A